MGNSFSIIRYLYVRNAPLFLGGASGVVLCLAVGSYSYSPLPLMMFPAFAFAIASIAVNSPYTAVNRILSSSPPDPPAPFLSLPYEIIDNIVSKVDHLEDLVHLSETCKVLHGIVASNYLEWFAISLAVCDTEVLQLLSTNKRIAASVRQLAIEQPVPIPQQTGEALHAFDHTSLRGAAMNLTDLRLLEVKAVRFSEFAGLFSILRERSPFLTDVTVVDIAVGQPGDNGNVPPAARELNEIAMVFKEMGGYTAFSWESLSRQNNEVFTLMHHMLSCRCPLLEVLKIAWSRPVLPVSLPDFWSSRWPRLRVLELIGTALHHNDADFFTRHPLLEKINLPFVRLIDPTWGALPNVRFVNAEYFYELQSMALGELLRPLPDGRYRPLVSLGHIRECVWRDDLAQLCRNVADVTTLKQITWEQCGNPYLTALEALAKSATSITKLHLDFLPEPNTLAELATILAPLKDLEELKVVAAADREAWRSFVHQLNESCPKLKLVAEWTKDELGEWLYGI